MSNDVLRLDDAGRAIARQRVEHWKKTKGAKLEEHVPESPFDEPIQHKTRTLASRADKKK